MIINKFQTKTQNNKTQIRRGVAFVNAQPNLNVERTASSAYIRKVVPFYVFIHPTNDM